MLDHLISADFEPVVRQTPPTDFVGLRRTAPAVLLDAQKATGDWLTEMGLDDASVGDEVQKQAARAAFGALTTNQSADEQIAAITQLKTPEAVRHIVGMLTAYDWEFVEQAKSLRGFVVAKLVEECGNANGNIRIKALTALGKVTEVGLFTERIEVNKKADASNEEVDQRIKDKLAKFMGVTDVADVSDVAGLPGADETVRPGAPAKDDDA